MRAKPAPWLSVVMPIHNGARDLPATLTSAAAEYPEGVEFLIYDSSEDEACREIAARYVDRLDIRYVAMPDLRGWPDKTNLAVANSSAPYVAMLHQDDVWLPGHVKSVRKSIAVGPTAVMTVAASRFIDVNGRDFGLWSPPLRAGIWSGDVFGQRLIVQNFLAIPSPVIRRDAWLAVGGMDSSLWYTADWDLYLKLARRGSIVIRRQATTAFRIHGGSLTMTGSRNPDALRQQHDVVLDCHGEAFGLGNDTGLRARALASVAINCGLAQAAAGQSRSLWPLLLRLLGLGPRNALRYLRDSCLAARVLPRLRARLAGSL